MSSNIRFSRSVAVICVPTCCRLCAEEIALDSISARTFTDKHHEAVEKAVIPFLTRHLIFAPLSLPRQISKLEDDLRPISIRSAFSSPTDHVNTLYHRTSPVECKISMITTEPPVLSEPIARNGIPQKRSPTFVVSVMLISRRGCLFL